MSNSNKIKYRPISYKSSSTNTNQNDLIGNGLSANKENVPMNGQNGQMNHHIQALKVIHKFNVFSIWKQGQTGQWEKETNESDLQIRLNRWNGERVILCEERSTGKIVLLHGHPTKAHLMALKRGCAVCWRCEQEKNWIRCDFYSKLKAWPFLHVLLGMDSELEHQKKLEKYITSDSQSKHRSDDDQKYHELQLIELQENNEDFKLIYSQFLHSANRKRKDFNEVFIYKIKHEGRAAAHEFKRKQILKSLGDDVSKLHEIGLYHGTQLETLPMILHQGFLRQFVSRAVYGKGTYFARDAAYSCNPTYSKPDKNGFQHLLFCNVICGEFVKGEHTMKVPPIKKGKEYMPYETTVDDEQNPSISVTYQDDQALPIYLISFKC